jgi:hypothetical protein
VIRVAERKNMIVYVKIDEYKDILDILNLTKSKIKQAKYIISKIAELKRQEEDEIARWTDNLEQIEEKVSFIDSTLMEPQV